ncbi:MAG: hypothetical protein H7Z75_19635 [Ferruginibacter sp.]|nr:hypothetical protein [Cytophagales bacterium]
MNQEFDKSAIEAYLRNELSPTDQMAFEQRVAQDPLLQNEVTLQGEIIAALQQHRRTELKERLNQIDVNGESRYPSYLIWASLVAVALLGVGAWLYLGQPDPVPAPKAVIPSQGALPEATRAQPAPSPFRADTAVSSGQETVAGENPGETRRKRSPAAKPASGEVSKPSQPTGSKAIRLEDEEKKLQREPAGAVTSRPSSNAGSQQPGETEKPEGKPAKANDRYRFHYRYQRGEFVFFGLVKAHPQVKLNGRTYLAYEGAFYPLDTDAVGITPLVAETNEDLIRQLKNELPAAN